MTSSRDHALAPAILGSETDNQVISVHASIQQQKVNLDITTIHTTYHTNTTSYPSTIQIKTMYIDNFMEQ